jgi:hypothetical protein
MAEQAGAAMMAPPQQGAALQQQPGARMRPTPTAPEQIAPSDMGNIEELLAQTQQMYGGQATENGGVPPTGQPQPAPPPPSPLERIMQVGPSLTPEVAQRYAETLERFEQGNPDMQITDPKQMVNFVKELQKVDGKRIDQGIKAMAKQLEQEQAQEMGIDGGVPTIDGGGGPQGLAPKPGAEQSPEGQPPGGPPGGGEGAAAGGGGPGGPPQASEQEAGPEAQQVAEAMAAGGGGGGKPPGKSSPPPQKAQQAAPSQAAVEKVAHVARLLARASGPR